MEPEYRSFDKIYVGGRWVAPTSGALHRSINPTTEEVNGSIALAGRADVDHAVTAARAAIDDGPWPRLEPAQRAKHISEVARLMAEHRRALSTQLTLETGLPARLADAYNHTAISVWEDAATYHSRFDFEERRHTPHGDKLVVHEPVGAVAAIVPWNGSIILTSLKLAALLAAGCVAVIKAPLEAAGTVNLLTDVIDQAGLPAGVVNVLPCDTEVGEYLVSHPEIDKVSFTGSTESGRRVMAACADRLLRLTLELGGKSPAIVLDDAPTDSVVAALVIGSLNNSGQVCTAATRVLVSDERHDDFVSHLGKAFSELAVGDPRLPETALGPLVSRRQRDRVEAFIASGHEDGARLITGGNQPRPFQRGWFVEPTLFADVTGDMRIAREEIFGPVIVVMRYKDIDDAVRIANDTPYGLAAYIFTGDGDKARGLARRIRAGQVSVNVARTDVREAFGGVKQSGFGREGGIAGMQNFLEIKVINL